MNLKVGYEVDKFEMYLALVLIHFPLTLLLLLLISTNSLLLIRVELYVIIVEKFFYVIELYRIVFFFQIEIIIYKIPQLVLFKSPDFQVIP